jgi:hypothetical protein
MDCLRVCESLAKNLALTLVCCICAVAGAQENATTGESRIFLQRTSDGRTVLTDRPAADAVTERAWQTPREDVAAARARREEGRLAAQLVSERVARQIEAQNQRDHELTLARMQLAAAQAGLELEQPDEIVEGGGVIFIPTLTHRPILRPPRQPVPRPRIRLPASVGFGRLAATPG